MKNFKKVLALVLVLATLLGLATMASATEYKDADKIAADYDEAVKVLDLIETMQGYPNGEFRPTANITREEAAKLIAIFDNKDADISTYYTSINPFADEKGRWGRIAPERWEPMADFLVECSLISGRRDDEYTNAFFTEE